MKKIKLGPLSIDVRDYASQGNAVLGIRDSGKSYFATLMAEQLMDASVPITAFDPIGLWRFLRVAGTGPGYPVVVAGGEYGDLPLTPQSAPEIVRAAMRERVSLVIDLYSIHLSKADWRRIVEACVKVMLYENKAYGLRHVFLEETAEFAPQQVRPDQGAVYDVIERMARMGGNALIGYTLINQRAEQVNKAILELCDNLFLFRQKGKNSLTSLGKWLSIGGAVGGEKIGPSLPTLPTGECWAWASGSDTPVKVKVPQKQTFHPDRRAMHSEIQTANHKTVDVGQFVQNMAASLDKLTKEAEANDPARLRKRIAELEGRSAASAPSEADLESAHQAGYRKGWDACGHLVYDTMLSIQQDAEEMRVRAAALFDRLQKERPVLTLTPAQSAAPVEDVTFDRSPQRPAPRRAQSNPGINGPTQKILDALSWWDSIGIQSPTKAQVAFVAGYSPNGGAFLNPLSKARVNGFIDYPGDGQVRLTPDGMRYANSPGTAPTTGELHAKALAVLNGPQSKILGVLLRAHPRSLTKADLAAKANYSPDGGAFLNPLSSLHTLGMVNYPKKGEARACDILFIER